MQNRAEKILKISLIALFSLLIIIFVFFNSRNILFGVKIKNVKFGDNIPTNNILKASNNVQKITGIAKNAVKITINDREISIDQKGNFNETISLFPGYNMIEIKAQDKFGNTDKKNYQLIN